MNRELCIIVYLCYEKARYTPLNLALFTSQKILIYMLFLKFNKY